MKKIIITVALALTAITAQAQVYAPPGSICLPQTFWGPNGPTTVVICQ